MIERLITVQFLDEDIPDIRYIRTFPDNGANRDNRNRAYQNVPDGTYRVLLSNSSIQLKERILVKHGPFYAFPPVSYWLRHTDTDGTYNPFFTNPD